MKKKKRIIKTKIKIKNKEESIVRIKQKHMIPQILGVVALLWILIKLSRWSLVTPYVAGAAGMTVGTFLHLIPAFCVLLVVTCYLVCYLINEDVDVEQLIVRGDQSAMELAGAAGGWMKWSRVAVLAIFTVLPIPDPPGHLTGMIATLVVTILIWNNKDRQSRGGLGSFLILTILSLGAIPIVLGVLGWFIVLPAPAIPLIAGLAIPNMIHPPKRAERSLADRGLLAPPSPVEVILTFLLSWVTPGLSVSATTSALIPGGIGRMLVANLTSCAINGWALGLVFRGGQSTKGALAHLLTTPDRMMNVPLLDGAGLGFGAEWLPLLGAVIPAAVIYLLQKDRVVAPPSAILFTMVTQAIVLGGVSAIILIPLGCLIALLQRAILPAAPEVRSLALMAPMWIE